jgi:spore germination protein YaaH
MSKLFENKQQIIHIATEIIALIAITFYFSQKNKKLMTHIEDLAQRIEDQEETILKHEKMINTMLETIQSQQQNFANLAKTNNNNLSSKKKTPTQTKPIITQKAKVHFKEPEPIILEEEPEPEPDPEPEPIIIEEENLDKELEEELEDLEDENIEKIDLESS